jgi:YD repeat-containing protein
MTTHIGRHAACCSLLFCAHLAWAQSAAPPGAKAGVEVLPETIVAAPRGETSGGMAPIVELLPSELESYGVDTLSDLVAALKPMTRSSRGDQMPVVLINGHLAGQVEFQNIPREAIERVEVLPETVALQYGFSENQRVLNFILREHYRAAPTRLSASEATEGGGETLQADASWVRLEDEARGTLWSSVQRDSWVRASDRGIEVADSADLTLQPAKTDASIAGTLSRSILSVSSSLEASLDETSSRSLQGVAETSAPVGELTWPLGQSMHESAARIAAQLTGHLGRFVWGATAFYLHDLTHSLTAIGYQGAGTTLEDSTDTNSNIGNLQLSLSGPLLPMPAGPMIANLKFSFQYQGFATENALPSAPPLHSDLVRSDRIGNFNASIPLASRDGSHRFQVGELSGTFNATLDNVSEFGPLWNLSYGLDWIPVNRVHLDAILTDHETAPTVQQVLSPPIYTPNVEIFDYVSNQTAYVTEITGGGGKLQPTDDWVQSYGLALGPFLGKTVFSAHYEQNRIRNAIDALPPLTAEVEQAFPERFTRDALGNLIEVDDRWINLQRERVDDLKWGLNLWVPLGTPPAPRTMPNRFELTLFDTWYLRDSILIRNGVPLQDLLNGAPSDVTGGQPRHKVELHGLLYRDGYGLVLGAAWRSATVVASNDPRISDTLAFSSLATVDLRFFADLARIARTREHHWARGARMSLAATNLFDQRQSVRASSGATPVAFEPGYLDPLGRTIALTLRKVF